MCITPENELLRQCIASGQVDASQLVKHEEAGDMAKAVDIQELKRLALAADKDGQHIYTNPRDANNWRANDDWHVAASPAAILSLIAEIERLTQVKQGLDSLFDSAVADLFALRSSRQDDIREALRIARGIGSTAVMTLDEIYSATVAQMEKNK